MRSNYKAYVAKHLYYGLGIKLEMKEINLIAQESATTEFY